MKKLSPRQEYRLAKQWELIASKDWLFHLLDLGIEDGLSGEQLEKASGMEGVVVGVDSYRPAVEAAPDCYRLALCMDAIWFMANSKTFAKWDVIVCAELIEHYERPDGLRLLGLIEAQAEFAIVTTPIGFMPQGALDGNPYQVHRSGWEPEDFRERGWVIEGVSAEHSLIVATWTAP